MDIQINKDLLDLEECIKDKFSYEIIVTEKDLIFSDQVGHSAWDYFLGGLNNKIIHSGEDVEMFDVVKFSNSDTQGFFIYGIPLNKESLENFLDETYGYNDSGESGFYVKEIPAEKNHHIESLNSSLLEVELENADLVSRIGKLTHIIHNTEEWATRYLDDSLNLSGFRKSELLILEQSELIEKQNDSLKFFGEMYEEVLKNLASSLGIEVPSDEMLLHEPTYYKFRESLFEKLKDFKGLPDIIKDKDNQIDSLENTIDGLEGLESSLVRLQDIRRKIERENSFLKTQFDYLLDNGIIKMIPDPKACFMDVHLCYLLDQPEHKVKTIREYIGENKLPVEGIEQPHPNYRINILKYEDINKHLPDLVGLLVGKMHKTEEGRKREIQNGVDIVKSYCSTDFVELQDRIKDIVCDHMLALLYRTTVRKIKTRINQSQEEARSHDSSVSHALKIKGSGHQHCGVKFINHRWDIIKEYFIKDLSFVTIKQPQARYGKNLEEGNKNSEIDQGVSPIKLKDFNDLSLEEKLIDTFNVIYQPKLEFAINEYNERFPEGIPGEIGSALDTLENFLINNLQEKLLHYFEIRSDQLTIKQEDSPSYKELIIEDFIQYVRSNEINNDNFEDFFHRYEKSFSETDYGREHKKEYDQANSIDKKDLDREENIDKNELVKEYQMIRRDHNNKKDASREVIETVEQLITEYQNNLSSTVDFRRDNLKQIGDGELSLPFEVTFGSYVYSFNEINDGTKQYVMRFVLPTTKDIISEKATIDYVVSMSSSFNKIPGAIVRPNTLVQPHTIDLVYSQDKRLNPEGIINTVKSFLKESNLAKIGANFEITYVGDISGENKK